MPDQNSNRTPARDWQSLLMASHEALLGNGMRMAQLGPEAGTMILQWTQQAALHQAEFGARSLQLVAQLLAARAGGNEVANALEATTRATELANDYLRGLAELQKNMLGDAEGLAVRLRDRR
jgi:hypothetical protein